MKTSHPKNQPWTCKCGATLGEFTSDGKLLLRGQNGQQYTVSYLSITGACQSCGDQYHLDSGILDGIKGVYEETANTDYGLVIKIKNFLMDEETGNKSWPFRKDFDLPYYQWKQLKEILTEPQFNMFKMCCDNEWSQKSVVGKIHLLAKEYGGDESAARENFQVVCDEVFKLKPANEMRGEINRPIDEVLV